MAKTFKLKLALFLLAAIVVASSCSSSKSYSQRKDNRYSSRTYASKTKTTRSTATKRTRSTTTVTAPVSGRRAALLAEAKKHVGRRYVYGGKTPSGFDCSGFTAYVYSQAGLQLSGPSHQQARLGNRKKMNELQVGDLLFFGSGSKITHVGMVAENSSQGLKMIHASSSKGVVLEDISNSSYWQKRYLYGKDLISSEYASR